MGGTPFPYPTPRIPAVSPVSSTIQNAGTPLPNGAVIFPNGGMVLGEKILRVDELIKIAKPNKRSNEAKELQQELARLGFMPKGWKATNYYGTITARAVKKYLDSKKAITEPEQALNLDELISGAHLGQSGKTISTLQSELKKLGYYPKYLKITGYYGKITQGAIKKYQGR